ncbi:hypothetical protein [Streptomyces sp. NPDC005970]|uniref:hypothetical protein n=1 Tax=Streptomyces sp. NPDC005970 TaxID=3156723 RepID=UPI0033D8B86B
MVSRSKDTHTTNRVVRIADEDWADYEQACKAKGLTRSADIRMHIKREIAAWRRKQRADASHEQVVQEIADGQVPRVFEAKGGGQPIDIPVEYDKGVVAIELKGQKRTR